MMTGRRKLEGEGVVEEDQEENMREEEGKRFIHTQHYQSSKPDKHVSEETCKKNLLLKM